MFLEELIPLYKQLQKQPVAFMGGFMSGILKLNLREEPLASWLDSQKLKTTDI
jgi:hypothetical protein